MSAEVGGRSGKLGDAYERRWAVQHALRLIAGELRRLRWEPLGQGLGGVDLELERSNGTREGHQLKRQNRDKGKWTVAELIAEGVLRHARNFLEADPNALFAVVSSDSVIGLKDLTDLATRESNGEAFYSEQVLANKSRLQDFNRLLAAWQLSPDKPTDRAIAHQLLTRISCDAVDRGRYCADTVRYMASLQFSGDPEVAVAEIGKYLDDHLGRDIFADNLLRHLVSVGISPTDMKVHPGVAPAVDRLSQSFQRELAQVVIGDAVLPRPEATLIIDRICGDAPPKLVVVHGSAGAGKSAIMLDTVRKLESSGIPCLPIQLHTCPPDGTPHFYGVSALGLPGSPAHVLGALAAERRSVLVLDQLDALRFTTAHSAQTWRDCLRVLDEAIAIPKMTVILACRSFDLENDPNIKNVRSLQDAPVLDVTIGSLPNELVASVVKDTGADYESLSPRVRKLLAHANTLAMWRSLTSKGGNSPQFTTTTELMRRFLADRRHEASVVHQIPEPEVDNVVTTLIRHMEAMGRLEVPEAAALPYRRALSALCSVGILRRRATCVSFVHQSYFDHFVAERVLCEVGAQPANVIRWLAADQSLMRRDQLRHLLHLLRDGDSIQYSAVLRAIITEQGIRFHLKHLVLGLLREIAEPQREEVDLVIDLLRMPDWSDRIHRHVLQSRVRWFDAVSGRGSWSEFLRSSDGDGRVRVLRTLGTIVADRPSEVDTLISSVWSEDRQWPNSLVAALPWDPADDSPGLADFRRWQIGRGRWQIGDLAVDRVATRHPERVVPLVYAGIRAALGHAIRGDDSDGMHWRESILAKEILRVIQRDALQSWAHIGRLAVAAVRIERRRRACCPTSLAVSKSSWWWHHGRRPLEILAILVKHTVIGLVEHYPESIPAVLSQSDACGSCELDREIASGLVGAPAVLADDVLEWLMREPRRYFLGDGFRVLATSPAREVIAALAPHCSERLFVKLESKLLSLHPPGERRSVELQSQYLKAGDFGYVNQWGHAQHMLLSALPSDRMSDPARHRVLTWKAKFGDAAQERARSQQGRGGHIRSPIPPDRLSRVSDEEWLRIISGEWESRSAGMWRPVGPGIMGERCHSHFAFDLGECAKRQPRRFAALALRLPPSTDPIYWARLMTGIGAKKDSDTDGDGELATITELAAFVEHVGDAGDADYARCLCRVLAERSEERWPESVIDRLVALCDHAEPMLAEPSSGESDEDDLATPAINCVRGLAAGAVRMIISDQPALRPRLEQAARKLLADPHPAVRHEALGICCAIFGQDPDRAVEWFVAACAHQDDRILNSHWAGWMIRHTLVSHLDAVAPLIARMARSSNIRVAENGAAWAAATWIQTGKYESLTDEALRGTLVQRRGVADAARQLICAPECGERCAVILRASLGAEDASTLEIASRVVLEDGFLDQALAPDLLLRLVQSRAFPRNASSVMHALFEYQGPITRFEEVVLAVAEIVINPLEVELDTSRWRLSFDGGDLSALLLRLYDAKSVVPSQAGNRVLDAWDSLLRAGLGRAEQHLDSLD